MKKPLTVFFILAGGITLAIIAFIIWGLPYFLDTALPAPTNTGFGSETVPAKIMPVQRHASRCKLWEKPDPAGRPPLPLWR